MNIQTTMRKTSSQITGQPFFSYDLRKEKVPLLIRGHHLLCLLNFSGHGYSPEFIDNMMQVVNYLNKGNALELTCGADAICYNTRTNFICPVIKQDACKEESILQRDENALTDLRKYVINKQTRWRKGSVFSLTAPLINQMRTAFVEETIRTACTYCEWHPICTQTSQNGFKTVRLFPHVKGRKTAAPCTFN